MYFKCYVLVLIFIGNISPSKGRFKYVKTDEPSKQSSYRDNIKKVTDTSYNKNGLSLLVQLRLDDLKALIEEGDEQKGIQKFDGIKLPDLCYDHTQNGNELKVCSSQAVFGGLSYPLAYEADIIESPLRFQCTLKKGSMFSLGDIDLHEKSGNNKPRTRKGIFDITLYDNIFTVSGNLQVRGTEAIEADKISVEMKIGKITHKYHILGPDTLSEQVSTGLTLKIVQYIKNTILDKLPQMIKIKLNSPLTQKEIGYLNGKFI